MMLFSFFQAVNAPFSNTSLSRVEIDVFLSCFSALVSPPEVDLMRKMEVARMRDVLRCFASTS